MIRNLSKHFSKVKNPVWKRFKKSNGAIETYYFIRYLIKRGKHHPQILLSMMAEYALVLFILEYLGVPITPIIVIFATITLLILIVIVGYLDVYLDIARKHSSFEARFSPEQQQLYLQVDELHKKMKRGRPNEKTKKE